MSFYGLMTALWVALWSAGTWALFYLMSSRQAVAPATLAAITAALTVLTYRTFKTRN